ncbi:YvrJ family protein [Peribacillus frigoritolerans]|jgi:hypothetical protein|uniref:YvrJ family protein n=1 Tax=Peribacillus frigoritolerans TaxID=450367 RepID=UPI000BBA273F|nr:YvrJ family protein [Peribacillus frigoritolerans]MCP1492091.1 hypothetical protein [Peribacillus frigoritolerans]PCD05442.1 YvrJ family protein [Peribacillus simplex]
MDHQLDIWLSTISNLGFPVVITLYLLMRFERKIDLLTEAINKFIEVSKQSDTR